MGFLTDIVKGLVLGAGSLAGAVSVGTGMTELNLSTEVVTACTDTPGDYLRER